MAITSSKIEKLTFQIFADRARRQQVGSLKVMFNPTSFSVKYESEYSDDETIDTQAYKLTYFRTKPTEISLDLIFDGTGVTEEGGGLPGSVSRRIEEFLKKTVHMNGQTHEPNYLRVQWGDSVLQNYDCRATSVSITYDAFDRNGSPISAKLTVALKEDLDDHKRAGIEQKASPDLTHARVVKAGDTLPLLCREIYGSPIYYLQVARANRLSNFRTLEPGSQILFPPLAK